MPEAAAPTAPSGDRIDRVRLSLVFLPLAAPVSDTKAHPGRSQPLTEVAFLFAEIGTVDGCRGLGFSYAKRAGGPALYAHAKELAPQLLGQDPNDTGRIWEDLAWAGASVGRGGLAAQAIAAVDIALWDLKARRAGLPLAKLLGAYRDAVHCYAGVPSTPLPEVVETAQRALSAGAGGIKLRLSQPDLAADLERLRVLRERLGDGVPLMVDASQQWDRPTAHRMCRALERFNLVWIEEPLDAHDAVGHAALAAALDTPIATGEMLTSVTEHAQLIEAGASDVVQPDAPRVGGITPFLRIAALADHKGLGLAPHFATEVHLHLAAAYPRSTWIEHVDWLEPLFNERVEVRSGRVLVPDRPGLGLTVSQKAVAWTTDHIEFTETA
ncbi:MAG TPA: mandelate racemase/muconate lactonizing enzyme family protein [Actinophytocola sp.]|uniref:L-talarate/galactarate dehydratase n=1 Tax=Actinophytocola sp. TaxID=1872138 RepID=UPI002F91DB93